MHVPCYSYDNRTHCKAKLPDELMKKFGLHPTLGPALTKEMEAAQKELGYPLTGEDPKSQDSGGVWSVILIRVI